MTKEEREVMRMALEALNPEWELAEWYVEELREKAITAIEKCLANDALEKKAENARELGLDYEPEKTVCPFCSSEWVTAEQHDRKMDRLEQKPVAWKLVPVEPTKEMLKAMDECSTEGYDERLYAGHAASVYMAAVDVAPTPPPVAEPHKRKPLSDEEIDCLWSQSLADTEGETWLPLREFARAIEARLKDLNT